ncbi:hypothetical protein F53441_4392 [Fusarium austroafricanum]|uniref:Uncharacterized protein n=1 Tax=Fusarium austroafricanum TaxID=2364996 RepID=A0A8H4P9I0_9HYPO|nr:hypothetical protein F53441_4392 [Fusarium austroafricanum]
MPQRPPRTEKYCANLVGDVFSLTCEQANRNPSIGSFQSTMAPRKMPPRKKRKITHAATAGDDDDDDRTIVVRPPDSDNNEDDSMEIDPTPAAVQPPDADNVGTNTGTSAPSVPNIQPALHGIALIPEIRLKVYNQMIRQESRDLGLGLDHHGRFLCPIDVTGLPPYLNNGLTKVSELRQEYLVEVFNSVVFVFTSSESMRLFSEFVRSHFNLDPAQAPRLYAKANIFHNDSFPQGVSLNRWGPGDFAHGQLEGAHPHVRA